MEAEALAKVLETGRLLCLELNDYTMAAVQTGAGYTNRRCIERRRDAFLDSLRALAPESEVGDREKAERLLRTLVEAMDIYSYDDNVKALYTTTAVEAIAQALATERAAASSEALERAAQVAESWVCGVSGHPPCDLPQMLAREIRAMIPAPERAAEEPQ